MARTRTTQATTPARQTAQIGRFDGEIKTVGFNQGDTVQVLLSKVGLSLQTGESINDERGNDVKAEVAAEAGKIYYLTGNYKQGSY